MIRATTFAGKTVAVFGLGRSGNATCRSLIEGGATVAAWDDNEASRIQAAGLAIPIVDLSTANWSRFDALVLAPGVPLTHPEPHWVVLKARAAGVEVIGDIEIFFRERAAHCPDAPVIAITGTNGKSTTTALIAHILASAGHDAQMGGNIGVPILALEPPAQGRFHVIEMSSFQIDLTPSLAPTVGVLLNITPDHLDRHGPADRPHVALRNYAAIKERLVKSAGVAIVGIDDDPSRDVAARLMAAGHRVTSISAVAEAAVCYRDGSLLRPGQRQPAAMIGDIGTLRGAHNGQNAAAALEAVAVLTGRADEEHAPFMRTYPGLPHRMEQVGRLAKPDGEVLFVNDSKATNADSTEKALASWDRDIFWILGGTPKEGGITSLAAYFPRIAKAYLIGTSAADFAATLGSAVPFEMCRTIDQALLAAARDAAASLAVEPVVLLSPACASYDQFKSFEHRGDTFRKLVAEMTTIASAALVASAPKASPP